MSTEILVPDPQKTALLSQANPSMKQLIAHAVLSGQVGIDVIERLAKLQREEVEYEDKVGFNEAMHRCQLAMQPIRAEAESDKGKYANYAQIDRVIRPIYTKEGFSLSFSDGENPPEGWLRLICYVSRGGCVRLYRKDMPLVTTGAKGGQVMTAIHAQGSSDLYAKRYLVGDIFNIAIDKNKDNDGNSTDVMPQMEPGAIADYIAGIEGARDLAERQKVIASANTAILEVGDRNALIQFFEAALKCATTKEVLNADHRWMCSQVEAHAPKRLQETEKTALTLVRDLRRAKVS